MVNEKSRQTLSELVNGDLETTLHLGSSVERELRSIANHHGLAVSTLIERWCEDYKQNKRIGSEHNLKELVDRVDQLQEIIIEMTSTLSQVAHGMTSYRRDLRTDIRSFFKVIFNNPHILPSQSKRISPSDVEHLLDKVFSQGNDLG